MLNRISGFVMIVNTLLPAVTVASLIVIYMVIGRPITRIIASVGEISKQIVIIKPEYDQVLIVINEKVEDSKRRLRVVGRTFATVKRDVGRGFRKLNIDVDFPDMPKIVGIQIPQLPDIDVPIGDVIARPFNGIRDSLSYILQIFGNFKDIADQVAKLVKHPNANRIKIEIGKIQEAGPKLSETGPVILDIATIVLLLAVPWLLLSYCLWSYRRLVTGWALFRTGRVEEARP